jgi:hypothetical protein
MTSSPHNSSRSSSGISSLLDLEIPGRVGPLPEPPALPGQTLWGINHGAALDNFPQNGLQLYIPAWSAMGEGDSVSVLLDNTVVTTEFIDATEVSQRVTAFIDAVRLTPGNHILQYRVARLSQNPEFSAETDVLVKLDRPGGQDQDGDTPGHSALKLTLPQTIINDGVDETAAKNGVPVTIEPYPDMAEGDDIRLSWGGEFVHHKVTTVEVGQPIVITVDEAVITAGGDSGPNGLAVTYEVYDVVDNRSEDWAAEIRIVVDAGNSRVGAPIVKEALNNVLDLDTLAGSTVTVQVVALTTREMAEQLSQSLTSEQVGQLQASMGKETFSRLGALKADFVVGDKIVVKLTGTTAEGDPVSYEAPELTIDSLPHVFEIQVPNAVVRPLAKTQAVFSYRLIHADNSESKSRGAFISVVGEAVRMAAPVALDEAQGAIDPDLANTTVQIPWDDNMAAGDQLILKWIGTRPDLTIYDPQLSPHNITNREATSKAPINVTVPGIHLKAIEGGTLGLYFILAKVVGGTIVERESARADTLKIGDPRAELPAPSVAGVVDGAIDPAYGATTLTIATYPEMAIGDEVHYLWRGSVSGDVDDWITVTTFTLNQPVVFDVYPEDISGNENGTVQASYWVVHAGSGRRSDSDVLTFRVGQPVVLDPPVISSIKDSKGQEIPDNESTVDTSVTLTGTAPAGQAVDVLDGGVLKGNATANPSGQWSLTITGLAVAAHAMKAKAVYGNGSESAVRGFTVAAVVVPTITSIKDASGAEIAAGGATLETSVTVTGAANSGLEVEVFDGSTSKGKATANASGQWSLTITGLAVAAHAIKAKALYGSGAESAVRGFTVTALIAPTISSVIDASGAEIPAGGVTLRTSVTVTGAANGGLEVEVFDGSTSKGKATANASGQWSLTITGLAVAAHAIKAKALYGSGAESAVHSFSVISVVPTLISIKDSNGNEVQDHGSTSDRVLTFSGSAVPNLQVQVLDAETEHGSGVQIGNVVTNANGKWEATLRVPERRNHRVWVYGRGTSNIRYFLLG